MNNRAQVNSLLESISGLALKIGLVLLGLSFAYILYLIFGGKLVAKAGKADAAYLAQSVGIATFMFMAGAVAVVAASIVRFFSEETVGVIMAIVGGLLYFFGPAGFNALTLEVVQKNTLYISILQHVRTAGMICFVPGCLLLARDIVVQIARIGSRQAPLMTEEEKAKAAVRRRSGKVYEKCWDMSLCNEHVKRICPAWSRKKPCWQIKAGCLCDQDIIRRGLAERDRMQGADSQNTNVDAAPKIVLSAEQKKERCRACTVYAEHQRQKFRIASPVAIIVVLAVFALTYSRLSAWLYGVLQQADKFMSFVSVHGKGSFATQGHTVTVLAIICLVVVALSVTLKLLEYMIHELQV